MYAMMFTRQAIKQSILYFYAIEMLPLDKSLYKKNTVFIQGGLKVPHHPS